MGCVLLAPGDRLTVGGPPRRGGRADLPLVAPLRAVHVEILRGRGGVGGDGRRRIVGGGPRRDGSARGSVTLGPGNAVKLAVTTPNALSPAAVVTVPSGHPPAPALGVARLEAAVIAAGPVIVGPGADAHVRVRGARDKLLLRCGADGWAARGLSSVNGKSTDEHAGGAAALAWAPVAAGDALAGGGVSLRLAAVPDSSS